MLSIAFSMQLCVQKSNSELVPEKALSTFNEKFPNAKNVKWDKENETEWEAEFKMNGIEYSANFIIEGVWNETEYEIKESEIPADIRLMLNQNFEDYEIEKAEIAETAAGRSYEFEIEVGEEAFEVVIDAKGKLTKEKGSEENDEN